MSSWLLLSLMAGSLWAWIGLRIGARNRRAAEFFCGLAFFSLAAFILGAV